MQTHAQRLIKIRSNHFLQLTSPCQHDSGERFVLTEGWHHELLCGCAEGIWKITRNSISLLSKEEGLTYNFPRCCDSNLRHSGENKHFPHTHVNWFTCIYIAHMEEGKTVTLHFDSHPGYPSYRALNLNCYITFLALFQIRTVKKTCCISHQHQHLYHCNSTA